MGLKATMRGRERGRLLNSGGLLKGLWSRLQSSLFLLPVHHSGCTHTGAISCPLLHCLTLTPANRMHGATPSLKLLLIHACRHENIANTLHKRPLIVLGGYLRASYVVCFQCCVGNVFFCMFRRRNSQAHEGKACRAWARQIHTCTVKWMYPKSQEQPSTQKCCFIVGS